MSDDSKPPLTAKQFLDMEPYDGSVEFETIVDFELIEVDGVERRGAWRAEFA